MSDYRVIVTRSEPNPDYDAQITEWERAMKYSGQFGSSPPLRNTERQVLDVTLTEAEYIAVKRAAIEVAK